ARVLASLPLLNLRVLDLCINSIGGEGIAALVRSPHLGKLEDFDIGFNDLTDAGVAELIGSGLFTQLKRLALASNPWGEATAQAFRRAPPSALADLNLYSCRVGASDAQALAASPALAQLEELDLSKNELRDAGLEELAWRSWEHLR